MRRIGLSVVLSLLVAVITVVGPAPIPPAAAAELPPVFSLKWGTLGNGDGQFSGPTGVAVDATGNVYVLDRSNNRVQKFTSTGTYLTQWGTNGAGNGQFNSPTGVAVDGSSNVYVADRSNHRIQKFTSTGTYLTQWGTNGTGNGQFSYPFGVAVDASGNVYVADTSNARVQKFTSTGTYLTQWGGLSGTGILVDPSGNVYVADGINHRIQKFTSTGTYLTQWGTNGSGNGQFNWPYGMAADGSGNVYVADAYNHRIQKFTSTGAYLTKWGTGGTGNGQFNQPIGVAVDTTGNIYVADTGNNRIQKFVPAAPAVTIAKSADETAVTAGAVVHYHVTVTNTGNTPLTGVTVTDTRAPACAGALADIAVGANRVVNCSYTTTLSDIGTYANTATVDTVETDPPVTSNTVNVTVNAAAQSEPPPVFIRTWGTAGSGNGQFSAPVGVAVDATGNVYVADYYLNRVQKFSATGAYVGQWGSFGVGNGQFNVPQGVAVDAAGNVYVADQFNNRIQKFTSSGAYLTQWGTAGTGNGQFTNPVGVAVDTTGNVYVADYNNHRIQKFTSTGTYVTKWGTNGTGNGQFQNPLSLAVDSSGNVYVADFYNDRIQKFTSTGTYLGKWGSLGTANGQFSHPAGVAVDATGNVYVTDYYNHRIQKFTATGTFLTKWGTSGTGDGQFNQPAAVAVGSSGNVYVADTNNHRIQQFAPSAIRGTVTESGTAAVLAGTWVVALRAADYQLVEGAVADSAGRYVLPVAPGGYRVEFIDPAFSHLIEWWDNHPYDQLATSDTITTTAGTATTADAALTNPTGAVTGTITETGTGTPVAGAVVAVMRYDDGHPYAGTTTDTAGHYRITGLEPDNYFIVSAMPAGTHAPGFYDAATTIDDADTVTVTAGATTTADIPLPPVTGRPPTATLTGTLTDDIDHQNEPDVLVGALRAADFAFVSATLTDTTGRYTLTVPDGDYQLDFFDLDHGHEWEWYHDQPHPTTGAELTTVHATAGATTTTDEGLIPLHGTAAGTITDTTTGLPLPDIWVAALNTTDGRPATTAVTDTAGHYTLPPTDIGDYYLVYIDPTGRHHLEFHDNTPNIDTATPITITGSHTTTANAALTPTPPPEPPPPDAGPQPGPSASSISDR